MNNLWWYGILFFLIGSCIGSFCGVLIEDRVKKRKIMNGRSQCVSCKKILKWYELIPVFSYIIQGGKCRKCGKRIPAWIFHIEWISGLIWGVFGMLFLLNGFSLIGGGLHLLLLSLLVMIAVYDARTMLIPDKFSLPTIILVIIFMVSIPYFELGTSLFPSAPSAFLGALIGMTFYLLQMMLPALMYYSKKGKIAVCIQIFFLPILFPFWLVLKMLFGEKAADTIIPTVALVDEAPTWVGGGDVRLGIIIGMLTGPLDLLLAISIGYTLGVIYFGLTRIFSHKKLIMLPVAPLLLAGLVVVWLTKLI